MGDLKQDKNEYFTLNDEAILEENSHESKLHHKARALHARIEECEQAVRKAHSEAYEKWIMLCRSQQQSRTEMVSAPEEEGGDRDPLLKDLKHDMKDYMKVTSKNLGAMKDFAVRFYQRMESTVTNLELAIYQTENDGKILVSIERELTDLDHISEDWTVKPTKVSSRNFQWKKP